MIEVPLGIIAWVSCFVLRAILHYTVMPRRRKSHAELTALSFEECARLEVILEDEVEEDISGETDRVCSESNEGMNQETPCVPDAFGDCDRPIEDESQQIQQLLHQTGSELLNASWSSDGSESMTFFERLAKEQLESQDGVGRGDEYEYDETNAAFGEKTLSLQAHLIDAY